jgi:hypothetical protein
LFLGLSGSALFILPIGILFAGISTYTFKSKSYSSLILMLSALMIPLLVGGVFIYQFGGLNNDSYWRMTSTMPFGEYVRITFSDRQIWLYVGLCAVISTTTHRKSLNFKAVKSFVLYQILLALVLLNPYLVNGLQMLVPPDGFWRLYFLFQYPTLMIILIGCVVKSIQSKLHFAAILPSLALLFSLYGGKNIFTLQDEWGYPKHFKSFGLPKLEHKETNSVLEAAKKCNSLVNGGIVLAPEKWEVAVHMLFPKVNTVSARHMHHNFLNTQYSILMPESVRNGATNFVSGIGGGNYDYFKIIITNSVSMVVVHIDALQQAKPLLLDWGYREASEVESYIVFCRETKNN